MSLKALIRLMEYSGKQRHLDGPAKKRVVLNMLKDERNIPEEIKPLLIELIDLLISVEKGKIRFNPMIKKKYFPCC